MDSLWIAALMGIVEGLTEFLPISSTGHLILAGETLGLSGPKVATFEIVIQLGAILAVVLLYWPRFWGLLCPSQQQKRASQTSGKAGFYGFHGIGLLLLTTLPGATLGLLASGLIKTYLFSPLSVATALALGAVLMLTVERYVTAPRKYHIAPSHGIATLDDLSARQAFLIGCCQCLALWPGFSRSASTIMGGMLLGLQRELAAEYSFVAAVPIIVGAAGYDLLKSFHLFSVADIPFFVVGTLLSFVAALVAIRTFIALLGRWTLRPFAVYRLLLIIPVWWFLVR